MEKNIFDQIAQKYDSEKQIKLAKIIVEEIKPLLRDSKSKVLMDYGSGTGLISLALSDEVGSVLLVDSSKQMLEIAKNRILKEKITNSEVLLSDFTKNTSNLQVDIVLMSLVLLHIPNTKKFLRKLFNILNDGGELIIIDFDKNDKIKHPKIHNGFSHESLERELSSVGFKSTKIKTFYHGTRIFMNQNASMFIANSIK